MHLVIPIILALFVTAATVRSDPDIVKNHGDLKSAEARQKIYDIISSHENRKYGDHGGHEYEEGEVPRRSSSSKSKRYGYIPEDGQYYYVDQPKQPEIIYEPKKTYAGNVYSVPISDSDYAAPKERYPVVETLYVQPKKGYSPRDSRYTVPKVQDSVYIVPKSTKENVYRDSYVEDKTAPITIGKTARTVYPSSVSKTHYGVLDPKAPSEYLVVNGQKPPRPLILDPKLKATYHQSQPEAHYSSPEHQVVLKPEVSIPVHYPAPAKDYDYAYYDDHKAPPVKKYVHYDDHKLAAPVKEYIHYDDHKSEDKGHHASGLGYYKDNGLKKESGHKSHGHHEISGHKAHSSVAGHHDQHAQHHNRGLYERDRGYHYEKAYAYDRVRAHHDIGSNRGSHSSYGAHQGHEGHKDAGHIGAQTYSYFKKDGNEGGHGYQNGNSLYKKGGYYGEKYVPTYYHG